MVMLILLAAAAAQPSPDALRLGRKLAEVGTLATILPMMKKSEVEELINDHPELDSDDQAKLRASADRVFETGRERLLSATGRAYAEHLSIADLRSVLAFQSSAVAKRYRAVTPQVIADTMKNVGKLDFKGDVAAAYCKETGKLCRK